jgi:hypothetical protein
MSTIDPTAISEAKPVESDLVPGRGNGACKKIRQDIIGNIITKRKGSYPVDLVKSARGWLESPLPRNHDLIPQPYSQAGFLRPLEARIFSASTAMEKNMEK